jgi:diaminohydroxyphosphoribosylaminopyrimidine deaminase/5-amino-6-(5-phosphoribosylamino)uracil reductase
MVLQRGYGLCGYLAAIDQEATDKYAPLTQSFLNLAPKDDQEAMTWALIRSMHRAGISNPNPNVGCIIVSGGVVVAEGSTHAYGGWHAEREAIKDCPKPELLKGATAYVTLEPCSHHGKQPPCTEALISSGIKKCVIGCDDLHPLVHGKGIQDLRSAGIEVSISKISRECRAFNLPFFFNALNKRPFFVGKWAQTLNGLLADDQGVSQWISGPQARRLTHYLRSKYDAIMVGAGTILADLPSLDARDAPWHKRNPLKILFDPSGRLASLKHGKIVDTLLTKTLYNPQKIVYVTSSKKVAPEWLQKTLAPSYMIAFEDYEYPRLISKVKQELNSESFIRWHGHPIQSVLVEGGASLLNYLISEDALDALQFFTSPAVLSGKKHHLGSLKQGVANELSSMKKFSLLQSHTLGDDVYFEMVPASILSQFF